MYSYVPLLFVSVSNQLGDSVCVYVYMCALVLTPNILFSYPVIFVQVPHKLTCIILFTSLNVVPIPESKDLTNPNNYRPI